jgi:hypothetical protein
LIFIQICDASVEHKAGDDQRCYQKQVAQLFSIKSIAAITVID